MPEVNEGDLFVIDNEIAHQNAFERNIQAFAEAEERRHQIAAEEELRRREERVAAAVERVRYRFVENGREDEGMNLETVKAVDLAGVGKPRESRISRLGIELEGGWDKLPKGVPRLEHDGSVKFNELESLPRYSGELQSPPLELSMWKEWMRNSYPQYINQTCGLHVHMSVKRALTYQRLMDPRYPATVLERFRQWGLKVELPKDHPLWERLDGKSEYCKHVFSADDQVLNSERDFNKNRKGHRYTVINYCWGRTGTAECRLLPAMSNVELAIDAIEELLTTTDKFLLATAAKEKKIVGEKLASRREISEVKEFRVRIR